MARALSRAWSTDAGLVRVFTGNALMRGARWEFSEELVADVKTWDRGDDPWLEPKAYEVKRG